VGAGVASEVIAGLGAKTDFVAAVPQIDVRKLALTPQETTLFALIGRASQIQELITKSGLAEPLAIASLLSLRAKGAIVPARVQKGVATNFDAAILEEIDLDQKRKQEILDFEAKLPGANYFQVLGVPLLAQPDEARRSFYELSRRFHPDRFFGKNLGSFRARVEKIFLKLTEAHEVLSDLDKRQAYLRAHPELVTAAAPAAPSAPVEAPKARTAEDDLRDAERRARLTRHPYLARNSKVSDLLKHAKECLARGEPSLAFNDLTLAARLDERNAEVKALLIEVRKKHDTARAELEVTNGKKLLEGGDTSAAISSFKIAVGIESHHVQANYLLAKLQLAGGGDLKEASTHAQRAVEGDPRNIAFRELYAKILEQAGMKALAKKAFEDLQKLDPENAEAKKQLKRRWPF
jgi:tetratricopeptide (TPR) repeat protein